MVSIASGGIKSSFTYMALGSRANSLLFVVFGWFRLRFARTAATVEVGADLSSELALSDRKQQPFEHRCETLVRRVPRGERSVTGFDRFLALALLACEALRRARDAIRELVEPLHQLAHVERNTRTSP
jgi:hypothetical protein